MDKLKNMLNPGAKSDDSVMYGSGDNAGKIAGQGSHFSDSRTDHPAGASQGVAVGGSGGSSNLASDNASTTALKEGVSGPYSGTSATSDNAALRAAHLATGTSSTQNTGKLPIYSEMTGQKDSSAAATGATSQASPYSSHGIDSRVDGPQSQSAKDTAIGGGAASAAPAAAAFDKSNRDPEHESVVTMPTQTSTTTTPALGSTEQSRTIDPTNTSGSALGSSASGPGTSSAAHTSGISGTPSAATQSSATPLDSSKTLNEPEHHYGRDAGIGAGAGAAALGAYEVGKAHDNTTSNTTMSGTADTSADGSGPLGSLRELINEKTGLASSGTGATTGTGSSGIGSATGAGSSTTGATTNVGSSTSGIDSSTTGVGSSASGIGSSTTGVGSSTTGVGSSTTGVGSSTTGLGSSSSGIGSSSTAPLANDKIGGTSTQGFAGSQSNTDSSSIGHSTGRNAALGAGAGAAGLGAYEAMKHHDDKTSTAAPTSGGSGPYSSSDTFSPHSTTGPTSSTSTTQPSDFQSSAPIQPIANETNRSAETTSSSGHHTARDGAIGAATGAGLVGSYDYLRHNNDNNNTTSAASATEPTTTSGPSHITPTSGTGATTGTTGTYSSTQPSEFQSSAPMQSTANEDSRAKDHHYARDGAAVAGLGAAGAVAAHEHNKHDELPIRDRISSIADTRAEGKVHSDGLATGTTSGTTSGPLATEDSTQRGYSGGLAQEGEDRKHHSGATDAALVGGAGVGAAGLAAHEHGKHTEDSTGKERKGSIFDVFKKDHHAKDHDHDHHTKEHDHKHKHEKEAAAVGTAGVGATALHEHDRDEPKTSKLKSLFSKDKHGSDGEAVDKHHQHHHGKEAAIGAGTVGAGAVGVHEYEKHHDASSAGPSTTSGTIDPARTDPSTDFPQAAAEQSTYNDGIGRSGIDNTGTSTDNHHRGLEAAAVGAGVGGVAAHEKHRHSHAHTAGEGTTTTTTQDGHHHHHHHHHDDRHSYAYHPDHARHANTGAVSGGTAADLEGARGISTQPEGVLHREGHFAGKEGGAPGAVGLAPELRDTEYAEQQHHTSNLHGHHGVAGAAGAAGVAGVAEEHHEKKHGGILGMFHKDGTSDQNRLHKDPPADHPAALAAAGGSTTATSSSTATGSGLPYGHHSENLRDNADINIEHPKHDPVGMGYGVGNTHETRE